MIRPLEKNEYKLLDDFLYEAIFIPEGVEPPPRDIILRPELQVYVEDFGRREGDYALCAVEEGRIVGTVWARIMEDYGHIDNDTPSLAISLYPEYRGRGIGTGLLREMLALLAREGYERTSLAVQKRNYAVKMYRRAGFVPCGENDEEYIMECDLKQYKKSDSSEDEMKCLLLMDEHNYDPAYPEIRRTAVRGMIETRGGILFIKSSRGELKIPGGGQEEGETDLETLVREVREETGAVVKPETVRPFGYIEEKRLSLNEPAIWHQFSHIYFCEIEESFGAADLSEHEKQLGMKRCICTLDEAIAINTKMFEGEGVRAWNKREYNTLMLLKEYYESRQAPQT
ncbi:MAG: GNAT family N-acetyltransferase [Ruminococcus sp.]|nr:GNAT family N-acetyltransferase [Ruminococcus sp.]